MTDAQKLEVFLHELEETLQELQGIQDERTRALRAMNTDELESLAHSEGECALRARRALSCQESSSDRDVFGPLGALRQQIQGLAAEDRAQIRERLASLRDHAEVVREMLAANWLVTYRMNQHVQGILEILSCDDFELGESDEGTGLYLDHQA